MTYFEELREITKEIPGTVVDFALDRDRTSAPTQASSNFITNKEQGDWAEDLLYRAINENSTNYVAVRYGKSDDLVAGEEGFDEFYNEFQDELDTIGKRPDLLIFHKDDFDEELGKDISKVPHGEITDYVKNAVAGLEVRSSAFLIDTYEDEMNRRTTFHKEEVFRLKDYILNNYADILKKEKRKYIKTILEGINEETIYGISFRRPSWRSNERLQELTLLLKELKDNLKMVQKRDYLSITPKVEDLKVVYRWAENFNVPHYYFQVFFDKSYGISFKKILSLLTDSDKEGEYYEISKDIKNQNKTTIKVNTKKTKRVAYKVDEPEHISVRREMGRGRLLFYVSFEKGTAYLDVDNLMNLLNIQEF
jgi:hypothetical protein